MRADDPDSAAVFDFLADLEADEAASLVRPLADYLARFPGHEEAIAAAFVRHQVEGQAPGAAPAATDGDERRVGPYRLIEELGRGGQGAVWRAEDTRIERTVALKLLASVFVTQERRARMRREAESVARLAHPGVCPVLEAEVEGDVPYLAMPLLEGEDLDHAFERGWAPTDRASLERVLRFFERAARALHAAHEAGLVHRDIKPANVFVTPEGMPVLLDFGLARDVEDESQKLTRSGELCGTPLYMSPEQLRGGRASLDRRTDVFSLGATLYEALTGSRPFEGATYYELQHSILSDPTPDARVANPHLPRDLEVVLQVALDKDQDRRYATAADLAEDLRRVRCHEPVRARPLGRVLRLVRWAQRQPAVAAASVTAFVALAVGLAFTLHFLGQALDANERFEGRWWARRAEDLVDSRPTVSLLVGIEAAQRLDDHQGRAALYGPLFTCQLERAFDASGTARCWAFEVAGDRAVGLFTVHIGNSLEFTGRLVVFDLASGAPLWTLEHPDPLLRLDLHPSGKVAVLGTQGGEVLGVDLEGQRELFRSRVGAEGVPVHAVEFAEDARTLVALTAEHLVRLAFPSGETLRTLPTPSEALAHVAHAPGDDHLLVAPRAMQGVVAESASAWILRRDPAAWRELPGEHAVRWAEWAPDHERVVIGDAAGGARVLGLDGELLAELTASDALNVVRFSPDGTRLALGTEAGEVLVHDLGRGAEVARFRQDRAVVRLAWSPTGDRVASAGLDATMRVYALDRPRQLALGRGEMRPVGLSWDEAGERVLTWNLGARVYAWCAGPMPYAYRLDDTRDVQAAGFDADGAWTLASGTLRRFELEREGDHHRLVRTHRVLHTGAEQVAVGDGRAVWVADGALQVSGPDGVQQRGDAMAGVLEVSLAPGGAAAAVLTPEGLHLVDALDGRVRWTRGGRYDRVVFSPDGLRLFACAVEGPAELLGAADGALVRQLDLCARDLVFGPGGELAIVERGEQERLGRLHVVAEDGSTTAGPVDFRHRRIAWSPRGDVLLGWGPGPELALYRREGARLEVERPRIRPEGNVTSIAFHPSGNWFAAATEARRAGHTPPEVLVWEVGKDDAPLFTSFPLHAGTVTVVRFGPQADDPRVLSAGVDGAFVWPLDPLPAARARKPRDFDHDEWARERLLAIGTKE